jgi:hypothetical protein
MDSQEIVDAGGVRPTTIGRTGRADSLLITTTGPLIFFSSWALLSCAFPPLLAEKLAAATTPVNDSRPKTQRQKGKKKPPKKLRSRQVNSTEMMMNRLQPELKQNIHSKNKKKDLKEKRNCGRLLLHIKEM